jgi:hypothetical protein
MKKLLLVFLAAIGCVSSAQTVTPNIGLQVPAYNQPNWGTLLNYDLNKLDLLLSGNGLLPAINSTAYACNGSYGTSGQVLSTTGFACAWTSAGTFNGYNGVTTYSVNGLAIAGGLTVGSDTQVSGGLSTVGGTIFAFTSNTANSGANFPSPNLGQEGAYWTGSVSSGDQWIWTDVLGTGTNPTSTYTLTHTGTSGVLAVSLPSSVTATSFATVSGGTMIPSTASPPSRLTGNVSLTLTATSGTITGTVLAGTCDSGTVAVTGATVGRPVAVTSSTGVDVGPTFDLRASVTSAGTVTVYICGTGTPASLAYAVTVL